MDQFFTPEDLQIAKEARLLVAIAFHYLPKRSGYLTQVLQSLAGFPVDRLEIVIFTNTSEAKEHAELESVFQSAGLESHQVRVEVAKQLEHPFHLTWAHKYLITDHFLTHPEKYTHFIYLEDDEELTFEAFSYFLAARKILRKFSLLPALVRVEWDAKHSQHVAADNLWTVDVSTRPLVSNGVYAFLEPHNIYFGSFILDQELAREYVTTRSFVLKQSHKMTNWHVRERSAMGLTFEKPPSPFVYRCVVPVSVSTFEVPKFAWLAHLPNRFAANPNTPFGKLATSRVFAGSFPAALHPTEHYELFGANKLSAYRHRLNENSKRRFKMFLKHFFPDSPRLG